MHLSSLGIRCNGGIGLAVNQVQYPVLHLALAASADFYHPGYKDGLLALLKPWEHLVIEHGVQLSRRSRKQNGSLAFPFQDQPRGHAVMVVKDQRTLWHGGHFPVVFRNLFVYVIYKKCFQMLPCMRVFHQLHTHDVGAYLLCQVIFRGTQSSGQYDKVRPFKGCFNHILHPSVIVPHRDLIIHIESKEGALFRQEPGIAVHNIPH